MKIRIAPDAICILTGGIPLILALTMITVGSLFTYNFPVVNNVLSKQLKPNFLVKESVGEYLEVRSQLGLMLFISGIIQLVLCFFGLHCGVLKSRRILFLWVVLNWILVISEVIVVVMFYGLQPNLLENTTKRSLDLKVSNFLSMQSNDKDSLLLSTLMISLKCCGSNNGSDFDTSVRFQRQQTYMGPLITLSYPIPCCHFSQSNQPEGGCPQPFTTINSHIETGCWSVLQRHIDSYSHIIFYLSLGCIAFQTILQLSSLVLLCFKKREKPSV